MRNYWIKRKMAEAGDNEGSTGIPVPGQAQASEGSHDEFGYKKEDPVQPGQAPPKQTEPGEKEQAPEAGTGYTAEPPKEGDEGSGSTTGYGDEPPKEDPPKKEEEPAKKDDEKPGEEFVIADKGDLLDDEVTALQTFVKKYSLPKEAAEALVEERKAEAKQIKEYSENQRREQEQERVKVRNEWYTSLKSDPEFGGDKFSENVSLAEKALNEYFPETKKELTGKGAMLPPCYMRDLAKLGREKFGTEALVQGGSAPQEEKEPETIEEKGMAFYKS